MDLASLRRLAEDGFDGLSADRLGDLAAWCWDWSEATGDARYCSLARSFTAIDTWWSEYVTIPRAIAAEIERVLREDLPGVLEASDPAAGAGFARLMRQRVLSLLRPPTEWSD